MPTYESPQTNPTPTKNPEPAHPGLQPAPGDVPKNRETTASKKVDDLSRHESKHDMVPKPDQKPNAREKAPDAVRPGSSQPQGGKPTPGSTKK